MKSNRNAFSHVIELVGNSSVVDLLYFLDETYGSQFVVHPEVQETCGRSGLPTVYTVHLSAVNEGAELLRASVADGGVLSRWCERLVHRTDGYDMLEEQALAT